MVLDNVLETCVQGNRKIKLSNIYFCNNIYGN